MQQPARPFLANLFYALQTHNDTHTHMRTHTLRKAHTGRQESLHPDPTCRPVAACRKPNHLYGAEEIAQGVYALQAGPGPSQPNGSGVFDGSSKDQTSERRHWSEARGTAHGQVQPVGSTPQSLPPCQRRDRWNGRKQDVREMGWRVLVYGSITSVKVWNTRTAPPPPPTHTHTHTRSSLESQVVDMVFFWTFTQYTDTHPCILQGGRQHLVLSLSASRSILTQGCLRPLVYSSHCRRTDVKLNCICLSFPASSFDSSLYSRFAYVLLWGGGVNGEETDEKNIWGINWSCIYSVMINLWVSQSYWGVSFKGDV